MKAHPQRLNIFFNIEWFFKIYLNHVTLCVLTLCASSFNKFIISSIWFLHLYVEQGSFNIQHIWSSLPIMYRDTWMSHSMNYQPLLSIAACKFSGSLCAMPCDSTTVSRSCDEWGELIVYRIDRSLGNDFSLNILWCMQMFFKNVHTARYILHLKS